MTAHAATPFGLTGSMHSMPAQLTGSDHPTCAVRLVDRRTGALHRINGAPLTLFTRRPHEAVAELLAGRDPAHWEARIEPLGTRQTKQEGRAAR